MHTTNLKKQFEKDRYCMIPTIQYSGKGKTMWIVKRSVVTRGNSNTTIVNTYSSHPSKL